MISKTIKAAAGLAFMAATAFLMAGCTVGPDYQPPKVIVPATYSTTQPVAENSRWWETFHDAELNSLVARAVKNNLNLQLAEVRIIEARAQRDISNAALFPTLNTTEGYSYTAISKTAGIGGFGGAGKSGGSSTPGTSGLSPALARPSVTSSGGGSSSSFNNAIPGHFNLFQAGFDSSWEIDIFGGTRRSLEAASADIQAQDDARRDAIVTLLGDVARNYVQLRGLQREIQIANQNLRSERDTLDLTRSRFQAGLATDLDVARAEAQLASTDATVPTLQTSLKQAVHRLGVLIAEPPEALVEELSKDMPIPGTPAVVPLGIPSDLLRRRPDVRRAERQLAAATARIGVATADLFPRFSLTSSLGLESQTFKDLFRSNSVFGSIGPSVSWPIFDAGRIRANIRVYDARERESVIQYQQAVLTALEDVENALTAYHQEQLRRHSLELAVDANRRAFDLATQLYDKGLADFLNVLDAQRSLFTAEDQLVQSEQNVSANLVALYKALGGGWEPGELYQPDHPG